MGTNAVHLAMEALNEEASREDVQHQEDHSEMSLGIYENKEKSVSPSGITSQDTIRYSLLSASTHAFLGQLSYVLEHLPWSNIQTRANYWGLHRGLQRLSATTSVVRIADDFQALVSSVFDRNIIEIILSHAAAPTTASNDVRLAFLLLTIGEIAEAFGCSIKCMDLPTSLYRPPPLSATYELAGLEINEGTLEEDVVENR